MTIEQTASIIKELIRSRRTTYADAYTDKEIPKKIIEELVTNATWAPNHKRTEPWRFIVLTGKHRTKLGAFMLDFYKKNLDEKVFPKSRYERTRNYPKNATMLAIILQHSTKVQIPEWEELAAISCAIQNLWLSCTAWGIGGYWDTSSAAIEYGKGLKLAENERCLGIFYMGYPKEENPTLRNKRKPISEKLSWSQE